MLITAVAIVGCRAAAKYLGQILGTKEALKAPRNLVSPMEPGTLCFFYPWFRWDFFIFLLTVLNVHSLQGKFREHKVFLWRTLEGSCTSGPGNLRKFGDQSWQLVVHVLMTAYVARLSSAVTVGQRFINPSCLCIAKRLIQLVDWVTCISYIHDLMGNLANFHPRKRFFSAEMVPWFSEWCNLQTLLSCLWRFSMWSLAFAGWVWLTDTRTQGKWKMITYFWVATLTCEDSVDPTMAIQFLDSNIWDVNLFC